MDTLNLDQDRLKIKHLKYSSAYLLLKLDQSKRNEACQGILDLLE